MASTLKNVKLVYANARGRAETSRWVINQAGIEFDDYRLKDGEWPTIKPTSPNGMMPFAEIDGKKLASSNAIAAYVAGRYGLLGSDDWQAAEIRMVADLINDTIDFAVKVWFCKDETEKANLSKEYQEKKLPALISILEKRLEGGKQWLVGDKVSLADIAVSQFFHDNQVHTSAIENHHTVKALVQRVTDLPNIKKWIANRPETEF